MALHTQTIIFMICMAYLVMHAVIWLALSESRNTQIRLWCASGIASGVAVVLLSMRGVVSEFLFIYAGQLLMLVGNAGRVIALRMYTKKSLTPPIIFHTFSTLLYYIIFCAAYELGMQDSFLMLMFFGFYSLICLDYFFVGLRIFQSTPTLGSKLIMLAGLCFSLTLGFKSFCILLNIGAKNLYDPGIDQFVMMAGQFIAITVSNIGFLRVFLERKENIKLDIERNLAVAEERANLLSTHRNELQNLLTEREEIIRQLTLSNKTAGMGALVASLAHELNQPLCAIRLNAQLVERQLQEEDINTEAAKKFLESVIDDNRRAANIITKLRSMFGSQKDANQEIDLNELVKDTVSLVTPHAKNKQIQIHTELEARSTFLGDQTQLQQVILNLLNNAVEATAESNSSIKSIIISTRESDGKIFLQVEDNGVGIPTELKSSIFELFKTTKAHGMGVGLWLSKAVVNAHQGELQFFSENGLGARFVVSLPLI
jgi:signal transduction histidine kinase